METAELTDEQMTSLFPTITPDVAKRYIENARAYRATKRTFGEIACDMMNARWVEDNFGDRPHAVVAGNSKALNTAAASATVGENPTSPTRLPEGNYISPDGCQPVGRRRPALPSAVQPTAVIY